MTYRAYAAKNLLCYGAGFCTGCQALLRVLLAEAAVDSEGNQQHRQNGNGKQSEDDAGQKHVDESQHSHNCASEGHTYGDGSSCLQQASVLWNKAHSSQAL